MGGAFTNMTILLLASKQTYSQFTLVSFPGLALGDVDVFCEMLSLFVTNFGKRAWSWKAKKTNLDLSILSSICETSEREREAQFEELQAKIKE